MNHSAILPVEILLVEDNPGDVLLAKEALKEAKVYNNLHVASDGEQALKYLQRQGQHEDAPRPDLIILDLNLPRRSGREVLEVIKNDAALRRIPVVVLTTSMAEDDVLRAYDLNANCYITKPIDLEELVKVVRAIDNFWLSIVKLPPK